MQSEKKPDGLRTSFNTAGFSSNLSRLTKSFAAAAAISLGLLSASPAFADPPAPQPATQSTQPQAGHYEYDGDRTIRVMGAINDDLAKKVIEKLFELSQADPNADIELRINSGGGSVLAGFAIYDVMKSLPNDIRTVCEGNAQSMAAFLLSAGTQGKRFSYPNCRIMYHQPSWGVSGQNTDMQIITAEGEVSKEKMIRIIAEDSGWPEEIVRDLLERNFYPTTEEAQEMGFIDHIIEEQNPDTPPAPKTDLPDNFCDNPGRRHMRLCSP